MTIRDRITQGEWDFNFQDALIAVYAINGLDEIADCDNPHTYFSEDEKKANAFAISKVPEMLELIERMVKYGEQWPIMTHYVTQIDSLVKDAKQLWEELNKQS